MIYRFVASHALRLELGPDTSSVLSLFHVILGCDTTSLFLGIVKNSLESFSVIATTDKTQGHKAHRDWLLRYHLTQ